VNTPHFDVRNIGGWAITRLADYLAMRLPSDDLRTRSDVSGLSAWECGA
jgi:hypothetical protein